MNDRILSKVNYYRNVPTLRRNLKAVVVLEDISDKLFWDSILQQEDPGEYHFVSGTRNNSNAPTGCEECKKYIEYVSPQLWVAMDSDMRWLKNAPPIEHTQYVLQTYAYSWENHVCEAKHLQSAWYNVAPQACSFDFSSFLSELSKLLFPAVALLIEKTPPFRLMQLAKCLSVQCNYKGSLDNNGKSLLSKIQQNIAQLIKGQKPSQQVLTQLSALGINDSNAYLQCRGHNLYDLIKKIGRQLCYGTTINFEQEVLLQMPSISATYLQMQKLVKDVRSI